MTLPKLIGVIHLPPLAGSPGSRQEHPIEALQQAGFRAVQEAQALAKAGFDGVLLENFGDIPFYKATVPPETIASMAIIAAAVRESVKIKIGIHVLGNDARSALAIAAVTGCEFIRVNGFSGVTATDQGIQESNAAQLLRERDRLGVDVSFLADVHVKHGRPLSSSESDLYQAIEEVALRSMADGVILTRKTPGRLLDLETLKAASQVAHSIKIPFFIGSGVTPDQLKEIRPWVDGVLVGSALRKGGGAGATLDTKRVQEFFKEFLKAGRRTSSSRAQKQKKKQKAASKKK